MQKNFASFASKILALKWCQVYTAVYNQFARRYWTAMQAMISSFWIHFRIIIQTLRKYFFITGRYIYLWAFLGCACIHLPIQSQGNFLKVPFDISSCILLSKRLSKLNWLRIWLSSKASRRGQKLSKTFCGYKIWIKNNPSL